MFVNDNNIKTESNFDNENFNYEDSHVDGNISKNGPNTITRRYFPKQYANNEYLKGENLVWKKEPSPLIITKAQWLQIFDSENNQFYTIALNTFTASLNAQFKNISCLLQSEGIFSTLNKYKFRFKCVLKECHRFYTLSINRSHKESEKYAFEVMYAGELGH